MEIHNGIEDSLCRNPTHGQQNEPIRGILLGSVQNGSNAGRDQCEEEDSTVPIALDSNLPRIHKVVVFELSQCPSIGQCVGSEAFAFGAEVGLVSRAAGS